MVDHPQGDAEDLEHIKWVEDLKKEKKRHTWKEEV